MIGEEDLAAPDSKPRLVNTDSISAPPFSPCSPAMSYSHCLRY